jgi:hypothetical protein
MKELSLILIVASLSACVAMGVPSNASIPDQIKMIKVEGSTGCLYARVTGAYAPFAQGTILAISTWDATPEKPKLDFKDCLGSIPEIYRALGVAGP